MCCEVAFHCPLTPKPILTRLPTSDPPNTPPPHTTQVVHSTGVFGCIRSLAAFRLTGAARDYVIVGSDSGRIVILDYNKDKNVFVKVSVCLRVCSQP